MISKQPYAETEQSPEQCSEDGRIGIVVEAHDHCSSRGWHIPLDYPKLQCSDPIQDYLGDRRLESSEEAYRQRAATILIPKMMSK